MNKQIIATIKQEQFKLEEQIKELINNFEKKFSGIAVSSVNLLRAKEISTFHSFLIRVQVEIKI